MCGRTTAGLHDRMPALLSKEHFAAWLGEVPATQDELLSMLTPFPSDPLVSWPANAKRPPPVRQQRQEAPPTMQQGTLL